MRKILFRGQTRRYGERVTLAGTKLPSNWAYGGVFPQEKGGSFAIIYQQKPKIAKLTVYADTVSEFTGLFDSTKWDELTEQEKTGFLEFYSENEWKGKPIFEGDIVSATRTPLQENERSVLGEVIFENGTFKLRIFCNVLKGDFFMIANLDANGDKPTAFAMENNFLFRGYTFKVVGNIYDNPELLKGRGTKC